jgi:spermidine synthase
MRFTDSSLDDTTTATEMLAFVPLCTHENALECLVVGGTLPNTAKTLCDKITIVDSLKQNEFESTKFDLIISFDDNLNNQEVYRILKSDGIFCSKLAKPIDKTLTSLGKFCRIVMPYHDMRLVFASNKYHPVADLVLDKSDFLDDTTYYNSEIHAASFVLHQSVRKELRGIVKN